MHPDQPEQFKELCEKVGLALMMGQKVQFSLAYYYSVYHVVNSGWSKDKAKEKLDFHLSKPMGVVVGAIEQDAPLRESLSSEVVEFKAARNWLAHDFDEESTPHLVKNERLQYYISKMDQIITNASDLMLSLHHVGEELVPVGI